MTFLLDVNVLLALLDPDHLAHESAQQWFETERPSWATCPITQNGALRILSGATYGSTAGGSGLRPADVAASLRRMITVRGHVFWPDDLSLIESPFVDPAAITSTRQVTDTYLLALAVSRGGRLATFDRRLATRAVRGGEAALLQIPASR